jgi:pilus assembly protein CpaF
MNWDWKHQVVHPMLTSKVHNNSLLVAAVVRDPEDRLPRNDMHPADQSLNHSRRHQPSRLHLSDSNQSLNQSLNLNHRRLPSSIKNTFDPKKLPIERIVAPLGRRIDESSPLVDARLKDGSRVNAIIPPLALKGPSITIRKFKKDVLGTKELIKFGTITKGMADFLKMCVLARKNILISGGTGSGKTTTLNIISNFIPQGERIITIEDAAELQIQGIHWIQLESRPPNIEGTGAIEIRDLMKNTLRMRPDRIIVGECRGGEALDMLQAMNTGHDGSLTTVHANNPRDVLSRLETMVMMSGMDLPSKAIREQIASAVDIIVQQTRFSDGSRKVTYISEVTGMEGEIITMQDIFKFEQKGYDLPLN